MSVSHQGGMPIWLSRLNAVSLLIASLPLALVIMVYPQMILNADGHYHHGDLMWLMWGISSAIVCGFGFTPQFWVWKIFFNPIVAWVLLGFGYLMIYRAKFT